MPDRRTWIDDTAVCGEDGTVRVGATPAAPAGRSRVCLRGLDAYIDPTAPDRPALLTVWDREQAVEPLVVLLGESAGATALALAPGDSAHLTCEPSDLVGRLARLGIATWLQGSTPDPLAEDVLRLEQALVTVELSDLVSPAVSASARQHLADRGSLIAQWSARARDARTSIPRAWSAFLRTAVTASLTEHDVVDPGGDVAEALRHEDELSVIVRDDLGPQVPDDLSRLADRRLPVAEHAGASGSATNTTSVDWWQVPRGFLDPAEDTVEWSVTGGAVRVRARAAVGAVATDRLGFRVYHGAGRLPLARGTLTLGGAHWEGSAALAADIDPGGLAVDVIDLRDTRPPRLGAVGRTARAERWAARGITGVRLGAYGPAQGSLEEAARLYRADAVDRPGARRAEARVSAVLRSVLARDGQDRLARALDRAWSNPESPATDRDVAPPDLGGPGWVPSVAESLLLSRATP